MKMDLSFLYTYLIVPCRFRKEKQHTDVEKGDGKDAKEGGTSHPKKLSTTEESGTVAKTRPGKWGRLLGKTKEKNSMIQAK